MELVESVDLVDITTVDIRKMIFFDNSSGADICFVGKLSEFVKIHC